MENKFEQIVRLYNEACMSVVSSPQKWEAFLKSACRNYKLRFDEQLLVFAQRPEATAVLEIYKWNKLFGRQVVKGADGIAVIEDYSHIKQRINYYFDIADTKPTKYAKPVPIWEMNEAYETEVIKTLEQTFGITAEGSSLEKTIMSAAISAVEDSLSDYTADLMYSVDNTFLEGLEQDTVVAMYKQTVTNSVAYMLMSRLGLDTDRYFEHSDFEHIVNFNNHETLNAVGYATGKIVKTGLQEISKTIFSLYRNQQITIEESRENGYNKTEEINNGRSNINEHHLQQTGGLQSSQYHSTEAGRSSDRNLRTVEIGIPQGTQGASLLQPLNELQNDGTSDRGGQESQRNADEVSGRVSEERGSDRGAESQGYDDLGWQDEQHQGQSEGDSLSGSNLRIEYHRDLKSKFFGVEEVVNEIFATTPHLNVSLSDIKKYLETKPPMEEQEKFFSEVFNDGETQLTLSDDTVVGYKAYSNGVLIWKGEYDNTDGTNFIEWKAVAGHFNAMRMLGMLESYTKNLPNVNQQLNIISEEAGKTPAFSFSQELIDTYLTKGIASSKFRTYEQFIKSSSKKENIAFLKNRYGISGSTTAVSYTGLWDNTDGKGIELFFYKNGMHYKRQLLPWAKVEKRIGELIKLDRYLNSKEKAEYPKWLEQEEARRAEVAEIIKNREILSTAPSEVEVLQVPDEHYEYHLGDTVFIGANEYQILTLGDDVVKLYDVQYPLFNQEMSRAEFEQKVQENPSNDHLKVREEKTEDVVSEHLITDETKYYYRPDLKRWDMVYYNPDSVAGGQFVVTYLNLNDIISAKQNTNSVEAFFEAISECESHLFDVGTSEYNEFLREYGEMHPDRIGDSKGTMETLVSQAEAITELTKSDNSDKTLAERLVAFSKDFDFYSYSDNLEIGETEEDTIKSTEELLSSPGAVNDILNELKDISQENLTTEQRAELEYLTTELKSLGETPLSITPAWEVNKEQQAQPAELCPQIPMAQRHNFDLASHDIVNVGKKERFRKNMEAIRVLKECEFDNRLATPEEQKILADYVGWGGLSEAFDENNEAWSDEFKELYVALSPEEYSAAKGSVLTAFYTPKTVISAMYEALEQFGFKEGNILEPSCGTGHFIGMLPDTMKNSKMYGVEIDTITAGIAKQLYQQSNIAVQPYEETALPDSFFDVVVGNVPFGDIKVFDKKYDKHKFLIHDYFFAKSLDKLRPGGIMAFITSKGTMDKENPAVRKYIAQRAELLGAIRLPNNTFKGNAGTEVVSDILFLQKRDRAIDVEPDWIHLSEDKNGITVNSYFADHPEMILGEMKMVSGRFGMTADCLPIEGADLEEQLRKAISNIHGKITELELDEDVSETTEHIPADPDVRNFSFTVVDDKVYFRNNSIMYLQDLSAMAEKRIRGMIEIRDSVRTLIDLQTKDSPVSAIKAEQEHLNTVYDTFTQKYGIINSRGNRIAFENDSSYSLLSALENIDENGKLVSKADMFYKRTIKAHKAVTSVDTAREALAISMAEKARVDMEYMIQLCGKTEDDICQELRGVIFRNHLESAGHNKYLMADEYLSGNVRAKLATVKKMAEEFPETDYSINIEALEKVQPKDLTASEISVRLGATWLPVDVVEKFVYEFLGTSHYLQYNIKVSFSQYTAEWNISGKNYDSSNVKANTTYGTKRANAYRIIEDTLNLKDIRIYDYIEENGKKKAVLNKNETAIAQSKQELIKQGFQDWVWSDPERRERLTQIYNEKFNSIRTREYDGSHITLVGANPEIQLREHQQNAVAHILYGGNTLLAHAVGAGKTFEMIASCMESKRLGLCSKAMFVVPNHLTEQWAAEFLRLYPSANILVARKKDFQTKNRKRFCSRIATGDYDAVIIGHSQFEKIPISIERQKKTILNQIDEIEIGIRELSASRGNKFSVKQLEVTKNNLKVKLDRLNDQSRKDDVITFEELGIDKLYVDESHYYKNLFLYTKMRNVGGIAQTEAMKSSDLFMKCRYLDELTGSRGVVFATGTPISNSMVELYTIQRYLQYETLVDNSLQHFDAWASTFGETVTAVELTPEGTGYRAKTRFAKFYNLPELMTMFREVADIKTADMLNLDVPNAHHHNIAVKPTEIQTEMVADLGERADKIRQGMVNSSEDNMLKITNDGRKLALDQRMVNGMLPDDNGSKVNTCIDNVYRIWEETSEHKSAQLVFCDLSTPKTDGTFSVYNDIRSKLIERGIPASEIKFIHEANTEAKKIELFSKTRQGEVRVLLGSTQKMGAGTNVQDRLIALHDLDCPWRPSDLEQRQGRIVRQGNKNSDVHIYRYVTEQTFDAYLYQLVEGKQKFASQIMTSKSPVRAAEDIDETALNYAEIKMLATGNPHIKEKMDLDIQVQKLKLLKANYLSDKYSLEDKIIKFFPLKISSLEITIANLKKDVELIKQNPKSEGEAFVGMTVKGVKYTEKAEAGKAILQACKDMKNPDPVIIGEYRGFTTELSFDTFKKEYILKLRAILGYQVTLGTDTFGNITRIDNIIEGIPERVKICEQELENIKKQLEIAKVDVEKPFAQEEELKAKTARLNELNALLNVDKNENEIIDSVNEPDEQEINKDKKKSFDVGDDR